MAVEFLDTLTITGDVSASGASFAQYLNIFQDISVGGYLYGDGSNLTNIDTYVPPADATFTSSVSAPSVSGTHFGDGSNLTGVLKSLPTASTTILGAVKIDGTSITIDQDGIISSTSSYTPPADATFTSSVSAPSLSGKFYGDGSSLTGVLTALPTASTTVLGAVKVDGTSITIDEGGVISSTSSYQPPSDATFTSSVSAPSLSGVFYGDGSNLTGIVSTGNDPLKLPLSGGIVSGDLTVTGTFSTVNTDKWNSTYTTVQANSSVWGSGGGTASVFESDITVSLPGGKTFGRYVTGDVIAATGKTAAEVIQMAVVAPIAPTVTLTSSTTIAFNQTNINNVLNFSKTINSLGATVSSASLEWRRNNTGSWNVLLSSTSDTTFTHSLTDTANNTQPFNYRYVVVDSEGATATATLNITPAAYVAPTVSLSLVGSSIESPENNTNREKGNISSLISGSVTRNSANVALTNYVVQFQVNGGAFTDIGSVTSISGASHSIAQFTHNPTASITANTIGYRIKVVDAYQTTYSSTTTVTFLNLIFYNAIDTAPTTSSGVRALSGRLFPSGALAGANPFNLNTGTTYTKFTVALPAPLAISSVIDLDASNANLTNSYNNNPFNVNDAGGTSTSYNVYTLSISVPYTANHRHQITRA